MNLRHRETSTWLALHPTTSERWMEGLSPSQCFPVIYAPKSIIFTSSHSPFIFSLSHSLLLSHICYYNASSWLNLLIYRNIWHANYSTFFKTNKQKNTKIFQHLMIAFSKFIYSYLIDKQCLHPFQSLSVTRNNKTESSFNEDLKFILTRLSEVNKYLTRQNQDIVNTLCKGSFSRNNQIAFKSIF